jgi:asparagine synthase (glutamine-hydrolysing)
MCGITGVVLRKGEQVSREEIQKMADLMTHRGPDAAGIFVKNEIGLGHRRLKIIDLSDTANQPMWTEDGSLGIVFNGEIYNFQEIKSELEKKGYRFKTRSDTEVVLLAFQEWKDDSFVKLNGMFAFGLIDLNESSTYLVRDRFGIKPLFYSQKSGRLAFASEVKPLISLPWISKNISEEAILSFIKHSHISSPRSIFKDIQQVLPGHFLKFKNEQLDDHIFWNPITVSQTQKESRSEDDWVGELEQVLKRVVSRQLISDVPLGCFLSGGVDSSLLVAAYSSLGKKEPMQTFSIGYAEKEFDETLYARLVATRFQTRHHEIIVQPSDFFKLIPEIPGYFDQPFADPTLLSSLLLSKYTKQKVTVAFSGDGGDELFFGYSQQRAMRYLNSFKILPQKVRELGLEAAANMMSRIQIPQLKRFAQQGKKLSEILQFRSEAEFFEYWVGTIGPMRMDRLEDFFVEPVRNESSIFPQLLDDYADLPLEEKITQIYLRTFMLDTVLAKTDRAGMAYGLEARVPFLDNEMVDISARIPMQFKAGPKSSKILLRKLLAKKLKDRGLEHSIAFRKKQGFSIPIREWLRGDLRYLIDEYLSESKIKRDGIFKYSQIKSIIDEHDADRANHSHLLWSFISFQMWKETYIK